MHAPADHDDPVAAFLAQMIETALLVLAPSDAVRVRAIRLDGTR